MSQSRELKLQIAQMDEIRSILNSMKNLAFMEVHKLLRFHGMQNNVVEAIEKAAEDFLDVYPYAPVEASKGPHSVVLLGAERGFCGDFNETLINEIQPSNYAGIIAIGSRLSNKWPVTYPQPAAAIEGANVAEETPAIVNRLIDAITSLQEAHGFSRLSLVYHDDALNRIVDQPVLPPFQQPLQRRPHSGSPPLLNLDPHDFFAGMAEHYLFAVLHKACYSSLLAENRRRLQHLEGAVQHLDDETLRLRRKSQRYRQEEITEEIEVILLNSEMP